MIPILKSGPPTNRTPGAIGDIYTDKDTGDKYECIFAYSDDGKNFDTEWMLVYEEEEICETLLDVDLESKDTDEQITSGYIEVIDDVKEEPKPRVKPQQRQNYTNYHKQYNKQNNR